MEACLGLYGQLVTMVEAADRPTMHITYHEARLGSMHGEADHRDIGCGDEPGPGTPARRPEVTAHIDAFLAEPERPGTTRPRPQPDCITKEPIWSPLSLTASTQAPTASPGGQSMAGYPRNRLR